MVLHLLSNFFPKLSIRQRQTNNIVFITFWSQFSVYALNTVLILFLTRPLLEQGLGYSQAKAYAFIGISQATGYLMPILGGFMADRVLGVRRAILIGSILLAFGYLLVMLSGSTLTSHGDFFFLAAYALIPGTNSLLMGTASGMVSQIYADDPTLAKSAMTFYYMAINVGALLATFIGPTLLDSRYGPLSVFALVFIGKSIAALNFAKRYSLYENVIWGKDKQALSKSDKILLIGYLIIIYISTLLAYSHVYQASIIISVGCILGIGWFFIKTIRLPSNKRSKQMVALLLIIEAVVFFVIYNQMNSTLVLFAKDNSNLTLLGFHISPAQYQMLNPLLIIALGTQLPRFYARFPKFTIPYQFAAGTLLAGVALFMMGLACVFSTTGIVNGNFLGLTYVLISLAELWVSAIGLSMIGLYCDSEAISFAMGVWYLASSLSNAISGRIASFVAIPEGMNSALERLTIYTKYYLVMGMVTLALGAFMFWIAKLLQRIFKEWKIELA